MTTPLPTTVPSPLVDNRVDAYLARLHAALAGVAAPQKDEILREIRGHILDSVAGASDREGALERVLRLLGTPEELATRYATECMLERARRSFSPWLLLRTSWRWAKLGIKGTIAFLCALFGYSLAFALTLSLFAKIFMPTRVGMWVGADTRVSGWLFPGSLNIGVPAHSEGMHEVLGPWFVPVIAISAFAFAVGTTQALRWLMRKRSPMPGF